MESRVVRFKFFGSLWGEFLKGDNRVLAYNFQGKRYDIGNKIGLLKANIEFGLRNEETAEELKEYLKNI